MACLPPSVFHQGWKLLYEFLLPQLNQSGQQKLPSFLIVPVEMFHKFTNCLLSELRLLFSIQLKFEIVMVNRTIHRLSLCHHHCCLYLKRKESNLSFHSLVSRSQLSPSFEAYYTQVNYLRHFLFIVKGNVHLVSRNYDWLAWDNPSIVVRIKGFDFLLLVSRYSFIWGSLIQHASLISQLN
jgi:hypothetical protein